MTCEMLYKMLIIFGRKLRKENLYVLYGFRYL